MAFTEAQIITSFVGIIGLLFTAGVLVVAFKYRGL